MEKLKYEDEFQKDDKIRAYDHLNDETYYVEGVVTGTETRNGAKFIVINCETDTLPNSPRVGDKVFVPMEIIYESAWEFARVIRI